MAEKKQKEIKITGNVNFNSIDGQVARLSLEDNEAITFGKRLDIPAELIQKAIDEEFDPNFYEVTGKYLIVLHVSKKDEEIE